MAEEVLKISIQAELREMQKSLATLPGITEREAKLMVAGLNRELRKAEAAAKRAAAASEKAWSKAGQGLKSALSSVGGQVGALGGQADNALRAITSIAESLGPVGVGAFAATAAIGGLAYGVAKLASTADDAADRLRAAGLGDLITAEQNRQLALYDHGLKELSKEFDLLKVKAGADAAGGIGDVAIALDHFHDIVGEFMPRATAFEEKVGGWRTLFGPFSLSLGLALDYLHAVNQEIGLDFIPSANAAGLATQELAEEQEYLAKIALPPTTKELKAQSDAMEKAKDRAEELVNGLGDVRDLEKEQAEAHKKAAAKRAEVANAEIDQLAATREAGEAQAALNAEFDEASAALQGLTVDVGDAGQAWGNWMSDLVNDAGLGATIGALNQIGDLISANASTQADALAEEIDLRRQAIDEWLTGKQASIDAELENGLISAAEAADARKRAVIDARQKQQLLQQRTKEEREQALEAFETAQGLQKAAALVDSIRAGVSLIPAFAYLGPFAPAAAAGVAAAGLATAWAGIESASAPEFPTGYVPPAGSPDHTVTGRFRTDEAVLTGRGVQNAGGPAGVEALNRGTGGASGPVTLIAQFNGREIARGVFSELRSDADFLALTTPGGAAKRPLYGR